MKWIAYLLAVFFGLGIIFYFFIYAGIDGRITSWWRTPLHNKEVRGTSNSYHLAGLAYDVAPPTKQNRRWLDSLQTVWPFGKIIQEKNHLHFQLF